MTDITQKTAGGIRAVLCRMVVPAVAFSSVLAVALLLSWVFVLPRLTTVHTGGMTLSADIVPSVERELAAHIAEAKETRDALVLPVHDEDYAVLKRRRFGLPSFDDIAAEMRRAIVRASGDATDAIVIERTVFDRVRGAYTVTGDVRNVGTRSMTVLAAFVDELEHLALIASVASPPFVREGTAESGFHSPFTLTVLLHVPSAAR